MPDMHPRLAQILMTAPTYYNAVADEVRNGTRLIDAFYCVESGCPAELIDAEPSTGERMLVHQLAKVPRI